MKKFLFVIFSLFFSGSVAIANNITAGDNSSGQSEKIKGDVSDA